MADELETQIKEIISEILEVEPGEITGETRFSQDLDADSMTALEILAALEKKFGIVIHPERLPELDTWEHAVKLVRELSRA